ncbi:unnamed protein product [Schistosoma curassoni]|uniref:Uncharacterized protein n=1 Tax=Schistosoma curassoni TaxID=6186 RepID=A0A183KKV1_9TREM|nr:unnamed protein product [Schistosoma curassoni]
MSRNKHCPQGYSLPFKNDVSSLNQCTFELKLNWDLNACCKPYNSIHLASSNGQ